MTGKQRAFLKKLSNGLEMVAHIGKNGITPEITKSVDEVLEKRELVKIAILQSCEEKPKDAARTLGERTRADVVSVVGKKFVLYRRSKTKPKIEFI
ncbi:MAG: YhbY family RNA-binding protein [Clostridiales bacterium]|nr:YhbY family RNA-binding protein [Clostridiales bacterium]